MFYVFDQNNSGGHFIRDEQFGIGDYVIIEAIALEEAISRAEEIGIYFNGVELGRDCECCGDRWYVPYDEEAPDTPMIYERPVEEFEGWSVGAVAYVHYRQGFIKRYDLRSK